MAKCVGVNLDRLCRELEGMECRKFSSRNLRLGMDVESSTILCDTESNMIAVQLEPADGFSGSDVIETVALDECASEAMRLLVNLTVNDLVICPDHDELLQQMVLHARTQWHVHKPTLVLPPFQVLEHILSGVEVGSLTDFGSIPVQMNCLCPDLKYEGLTSEEFALCDLISDVDLRFAHEVAIGQRQPRKPLL